MCPRAPKGVEGFIVPKAAALVEGEEEEDRGEDRGERRRERLEEGSNAAGIIP